MIMNSLSKKIHSLQIFQQKNNINKKKLKMEPIIHHHELENPSIKKIVLLPLLQPLHIDVPFKDLCSANNQIFLHHLQLNLLRLLLLTWRPWIMARSFEVFNSLDVEKGGGVRGVCTCGGVKGGNSRGSWKSTNKISIILINKKKIENNSQHHISWPRNILACKILGG